MTMLFSNRNTFLTLLLTIISFVGMNAQTFSGKIISTKDGAAVPFANVLIKGTTTGIATDDSGNFSITVAEGQEQGTIIISAVGFTGTEKAISELDSETTNTITLKPQEYDIEQVEVEAVSRVLYGAIKKCSEKIPNNYITEGYSCDFTYTNNSQTAQGVITDKTGYIRTTAKGTLRKISYSFDATEKDTASMPYFGGKTNMEDLLSFDLIRNVGNIIDPENVYDYDLSIKQGKDDQIWIIQFSAKEPELHNTGDAHATKYEGELYINKEDFALNKAVIRGHSDKRSTHGKSIIVSKESKQYISDINYKTIVRYSNKDGKLRLDNISMTESFTDMNGKKQTVKSSISIDEQKAEMVEIEGRDFYVKGL